MTHSTNLYLFIIAIYASYLFIVFVQMSHVVIVGCGVIGAAIAYELSLIPEFKISVIDKQQPAREATSAALGVLMGFISQKVKGRAWQLRRLTMQRYETLIPELEAKLNRSIPFNRQGIVMLCFPGDNLEKWENLREIRRAEGFDLEIWDGDKLRDRCPQIDCQKVTAAIYSPQDRQVNPVVLTQALVEAARQNGVAFHFGVTVEDYELNPRGNSGKFNRKIRTKNIGETEVRSPILEKVDWLIVAAGLSSLTSLQGIENWAAGESHQSNLPALCSEVYPKLELIPVLGQALQLRLKSPLGNLDFQPVITGDDVHIVPCNSGKSDIYDCFVGATVEFPNAAGEVIADESLLDGVMARAIAFCPDLAAATVVRQWSGLRPRPQGQSAPVIGFLPGFSNVVLATGHYRNGILLAPATAMVVKEMLGAS